MRVYATTKEPTKAEPLPADAPFVDIPDGMNAPLVVLLPTGEAGPLAFRMLPVEFSRTKAPEGAVLWFNLSGRTIFSKLGTAQAVITPARPRFNYHRVRLGIFTMYSWTLRRRQVRLRAYR